MTRHQARCARCGEPASGRLCANCGAVLGQQDCARCAKPLTPGSRFCHHCGNPVSPAAAQASAGGQRLSLAWLIVIVVLAVLGAFVAGQRLIVGDTTALSTAATGAPLSGGGLADIGSMNPQEAASRLFDRVMRYVGEGKADSAAFFAPMALTAYKRLGPPDVHARYDIGMIQTAIGDAAAAAAQADTILKAQPNHLLGLLLAARAADMRRDAGSAARYRARLVAVAPAERAKLLQEYADHQREIDEALARPSAGR